MKNKYKIEDRVRIISHKFPKLHEDRDISNGAKLKGLNYLGLVGTISEINDVARTKWEIENKENALYRVILDHPRWKNKGMYFFEEEIEKI